MDFENPEHLIKELAFLINSSQKRKSDQLLQFLLERWKPKLSIKPETAIRCRMCNQGFPESMIVTLVCSDKFCKPHLQSRVAEIIRRPSFLPKRDLGCPVCNLEIDYPIIKSLVSEDLFCKYDLAKLKEAEDPNDPFIPPPKPAAKLKCFDCGDLFQATEIISLSNCDHQFCLQCLRRQLLKIIDNSKKITLELFKCLLPECGQLIDYPIINEHLRPEDKIKFNELINKPAFFKTEQIQLPPILPENQIQDLNKYIEKLKKKKKYEDFEVEGIVKERAQIAITFIDVVVFKKLKRKIKFFDDLNVILYKNEPPREWGEFPENVRVVALPPENQYYQFVMTEFRKTCQNQIISISEIQNKSLYRKYKLITSELIQAKNALNIDTTNFEKYLWHGTRANNPEVIYKDDTYGFDVRYANSGSWGKGNYFGQTAQVSMGYLGFKNAQGNSLLLFNKVFVGESIPGQGGLIRAPPIPGTNRFYDSTSNASMVVVYDVWRAYPHYIVEFR